MMLNKCIYWWFRFDVTTKAHKKSPIDKTALKIQSCYVDYIVKSALTIALTDMQYFTSVVHAVAMTS